MAGERTLPGLGLTGFWTPGTNGYDTGMDANLRTLSALSQLSVISRTTVLPAGVDGDIYIVPVGEVNAATVAVKDAGAWVYLAATEGWRAWVRDTDESVYFDGAAWVVETSGLADAPSDGTVYGRQDGAWVEAAGAGGAGAITINAQTGTAYTAVLADQQGLVTMDSAAANTFTLPTNAAVAFPVGTMISVKQIGAGVTTADAPAGGTLNGTTDGSCAFSARWGTLVFTKLATDGWSVDGAHGGVA